MNGTQWHEQREFARQLFMAENVRTTVAVFERYAHVLASHWDARGMTSGVDVQDYFMRYTLSSFGEVGFGTQLRAIEQDVNRFAVAFDYCQSKRYSTQYAARCSRNWIVGVMEYVMPWSILTVIVRVLCPPQLGACEHGQAVEVLTQGQVVL